VFVELQRFPLTFSAGRYSEDRVVPSHRPPARADFPSSPWHTVFVSSRLSLAPRKADIYGNSVKAAARPTPAHPSLVLARQATLFLSLYLGVVAPPDTPSPPSDPTALPWPARAVSRVQRTPRFALRPWRVSLLLKRASCDQFSSARGKIAPDSPESTSDAENTCSLSWNTRSEISFADALRFNPVDVYPISVRSLIRAVDANAINDFDDRGDVPPM